MCLPTLSGMLSPVDSHQACVSRKIRFSGYPAHVSESAPGYENVSGGIGRTVPVTLMFQAALSFLALAITTVVPGPLPVTRPDALTLATPALPVVHFVPAI